MPEVSRFYGIVIKLFFGDHHPPHFHAVYGEYVGLFDIDSLEMLEGDLPVRARKLVVEWAGINQKELKKMWKKQEFYGLPPLK
ncbi:MAG: DUF4160 domain-containing protein [Gammaproteobacteria bacterium]|nr:DUF4160 domain-containing protein [Gammaproteobacteria bacterium]